MYIYKNETNVIDLEIKPNLNKKMDHIGIWCMELLDQHNVSDSILKLSKLLNWLMQCNVGYVTVYFENTGNFKTNTLKLYLQNTFKANNDKNRIKWDNQKDQSEYYNMTVNIIEKNQYK